MNFVHFFWKSRHQHKHKYIYEGRAPGLGEARVPSLFLGDNSIPGETVFASAVRVQNQTENGGGVATEKERDDADDAFFFVVDDIDIDIDIDGIETSRTSRRGGEETETLEKSIAEDAEETADAQKSTELDEDGTDGHEGAI